MGSQTLNSWMRGCSRQIQIILGIGGAVLLVFGGLVGLALSVPGATPNTRNLIIAGGLPGCTQLSTYAAWRKP